MADDTGNETGNEAGNGDGTLELTQEEFNQRITEAAQAAVGEFQAAHQTEMESMRAELARERSERHQASVREIVRGLEDSGHSPAVVVRAAELMLADTGDTVLELSQEGSDEVQRLTASDIVLSILESIPEEQLNLARTQTKVKGGSKPPESDDDARTVDEKAEELLAELRSKAVTVTVPT